MNHAEGNRNRRPGPIGFHAESKTSTQPRIHGKDELGIGEAVGPTIETPKGSKELKVTPIFTWTIAGAIITLVGALLVSSIVISIGILIIISTWFAKRRIDTDSRLRSKSKKQGIQ